MTLLAELKLIEERMDRAFLLRRFDTFNQLLSERMRVVRQSLGTAERDEVLEMARLLGEQWSDRLDSSLGQSRQQQARLRVRIGQQSRMGSIFSRSL